MRASRLAGPPAQNVKINQHELPLARRCSQGRQAQPMPKARHVHEIHTLTSSLLRGGLPLELILVREINRLARCEVEDHKGSRRERTT